MNTSPWKLDGAAATLAAGEFAAHVAVDQPGLGVHDLAWAGKPLESIRYLLSFSEPGAGPTDEARNLEDVYIRGRDLVAVYAETKTHQLRYTVYWRLLDEDQLRGAAAGIDVVVSVQTSVLDISPAALFSSQYFASEAWASAPPNREWRPIQPAAWTDPLTNRRDQRQLLATATKRVAAMRTSRDDAYRFDLAGGTWSCGEMIHPRDRKVSGCELVAFPSLPASDLDPAQGDVASPASRIATSCYGVFGLPLEKGVLLRARLRAVLARRENAKEVVAACREAFEHAELPLTT